jgi:glutamyl/glutaminyl-tRNA synthetase
MKTHNTRLNPTNDGGLHYGHVFLALINEAEAHRTGGKFYVRFDDNQLIWQLRLATVEARLYKEKQVHELEWCEIPVDTFESNDDMMPDVIRWMNALGLIPNVSETIRDHGFEWIGNKMEPYPYLPICTAEKVVMDFMEDIDLLIRGEDLITEASLYKYYCDLCGWEAPRQVYLPRLILSGKEMSKTNGIGSLEEYIDGGGTPGKLRDMLAKACLIDPKGEWLIENVKDRPEL